jgi:hypothetical protein
MSDSSNQNRSDNDQQESPDVKPLRRNKFRLKREATLGDIATLIGQVLTILAIVIAALTLYLTYKSGMEERYRQQAEQIRSAATETMAKIERWEDASLSFYKNLEPTFVEVSRMIAKDYDLNAAGDFLWKRFSEERAAIEQKKAEEKIETSYAALFIYHLSEKDIFLGSIKQLKQANEQEFNGFRDDVLYLIDSQVRNGFFNDPNGNLKTADLYKKLIEIAEQHRKNLQEEHTHAINTLNNNLFGIIGKTDEEVVNRKYQPL